jgi:hypothetical protein
MHRLFLLLLVAGCEHDLVAMLPDAQGIDLSCAGTLPTSAPATLLLNGTISEIAPGATAKPLSGVLYEVVSASDDAVLASSTTDAAGMWSIELATRGQPQDVYTRWSKPGYVMFTQSFAAPLTRDRTFADGLETAASYAGFYPSDLPANPELGAVYVSAVDCRGETLAPLEAPSVTPAPARLVPDSPPTGAWGLNITPGMIEVGASYRGTLLRTSIARVTASGVGFLELQP